MEYMVVGLGGAVGAVSRYVIGRLAGRWWRKNFPLATFLINVTGSFAIGLLYIILNDAGEGTVYIRSFAVTGILGAFTTFSTFSYEIINLAGEGETRTAVIYFLASLVVGLLAGAAGLAVGYSIWGPI